MKLVFFGKLDLMSGVSCKAFGTVTWHPIVSKEIGNWIAKYKKTGKNLKIKKFGMDVTEKALLIAQTHVSKMAPKNLSKEADSFRQYKSLANEIRSNSAEPGQEDLQIIYDAIETGASLLTNDDMIQKMVRNFWVQIALNYQA